MHLLPVDHPALVAAARHGLPADLARLAPAVTVTDGELDAVRMFCRTDRISGLFVAAVDAGDITVTSTGAELAVGDWQQMMRACVQVEALLVRVAARLDRMGVRWAVTKGAAVAHLDFPDVAWRGFADVDLVIHPDDWAAVLADLAGDIGRPATRRFTARYGKGETVLIDDMEVDLHLRFAVGRFGVRSRPGDVFDRLDEFTLAGQRIPALTPEFRLLHACFHAVLGGNPGLRALRDVAQIAASNPDAAGAMWDTAARWNAEPVVAAAVSIGWDRLGLDGSHPLAAAAARVSVGRDDRRVLDLFRGDPRFRSQALTAVVGLPLRARPRFMWAAWRMSMEART